MSPTPAAPSATAHPPATAVPAGLDACPFWPTYGAPPRQFVRGAGTEIWDSAGVRYLDFLGGLAVVALGHAHPEVAQAIATQASTLLHTSNLFATVPGAEVAVTLDTLLGGGGPGVPVQLRGRGQRGGHQAGPAVGRPRPPRGGERLRLVPRPDPGHAARHRPAGQARGVPAAARGLPPRGLGRPRRPGGGHRSRRWRPCCSNPSRARAGSIRPAPPTSRAWPGCAPSAACCSWSTRSRPGSGARDGGSASSTTTWCPTW